MNEELSIMTKEDLLRSENKTDSQTVEEILTLSLEKTDTDNFLKIFGGHILFQALYSAVEFDLFTILSNRKKLTLDQIAETLNIKRQPARILMISLVSSDLIKKDAKGFYYNSPVAEAVLTKHSPKNVISYVKLQYHVMYKGMFRFHDSIKSYKNEGLNEFEGDEPTLYQRLAHDSKVKNIFQEAMHELSMHANADLANNIDLSKVNTLIDIGGGDGTNIIALAEKFNHLTASVFDLQTVCPIAEKKINETAFSNRLNVIPGNCFEESFPKRADCFLFSHFCTIWSAEKNKLLFKKAYDALPSGGQIIIFNMMMNNDETGPLTAALGSPYFLTIATGEGLLYTWNEYKQWMKDSGFINIKSKPLAQDHGVIVGIKP